MGKENAEEAKQQNGTTGSPPRRGAPPLFLPGFSGLRKNRRQMLARGKKFAEGARISKVFGTIYLMYYKQNWSEADE